MGQFHDKRFPGESDTFREARDALLEAERDLRRQVEAVAALRRDLPDGGALKEDYGFAEGAADPADRETVTETRMSKLFEDGKASLVIYSFMYGPDWEAPCPACTSILDSLNASAPHIGQRVNLAVVAKAPIGMIRDFAASRGWTNLRLLSSADNTYNADYFAETPDGDQIPAVNVFRRTDAGIHHFYSTELLYAPTDDGQHPRHADMFWPLWNILDLTPEGRGKDWFPSISYD